MEDDTRLRPHFKQNRYAYRALVNSRASFLKPMLHRSIKLFWLFRKII